MAEYFQIPEVGTKVRPGSYFNVDKNGDDDSFGAIDGVVVAVFKATFGPVDKVTVLERGDDYTTIYGDGLTTDLIREVLYGGAKKVICCRLNGTGGAVASVSLAAATGKVKITAKHPGEMPFSVTIRNRLTDKDRKECIIYTGTTEFEKVYFSAGDNEAASLVSAFANSKNFTANLEESAKGIMTNVNQTAFTGGKNPTVATANYSAAFSQAEKYFFNTICVDTEDTAVHALLQAFLDRIYETSQFGIGVVAEKDNKDLDERMNAAAGFDGENIVYVLNPKVFINEGTLDGYQTAGLIAGLIAATPANQAVTHMVITRYVDLVEPLTNTQIIKAELKGCLVLSKSIRIILILLLKARYLNWRVVHLRLIFTFKHTSANVNITEATTDASGAKEQAQSEVESTFSESMPADGHTDVTLDQTNNAAEVYSEVASEVQSTFSNPIAASCTVNVTLDRHITKPSAGITTSGSGSSVTASIAGNAEGSIVAGPLLSWVGEDGPEAIIPLGSKRRDRGMDLWLQAGRALGVKEYADGGMIGDVPLSGGSSDSTSGDSSGSGDKGQVVINMNPVFNINGNSGNDTVNTIKEKLKELINEMSGELATRLLESYANMPT